MSKPLPRILLLYRLHSSSFTAIPWVLARSGECQLDVIAPANHLIRHSAWIDRHSHANTDEDFIDQVCQHLVTGDYQAMLCIDMASKELVFAHANRPELSAYLPFSPDSELHRVSEDKIAFHEWCDRLDFPAPKTVCTRNRDEVTMLAQDFIYPFILKSNEGSGGSEIDIITTPAELSRTLETKPKRKGWILQEFIEGEVGTTTIVANQGQLFTSFSVFNRVCLREGLGPAAICEFADDPHLIELIQHVVRTGNLSGFTGFDWIRSKEGKYYLIDPHFGRATPGSAIAHLHGVNLGQAYLNSIGIPSSTAPLPKHKSKVVWVFPQIYSLLFSSKGLRQLTSYSPFRKAVTLFCCGAKDGRLFRHQSWDCLAGGFSVLFGKCRRQLISPFKFPRKQQSFPTAQLAKPPPHATSGVDPQ